MLFPQQFLIILLTTLSLSSYSDYKLNPSLSSSSSSLLFSSCYASMERNSILLHPQHHLSSALFLTLVAIISFSTAQQHSLSPKTDAQALFRFKDMIENDPNGVLSGWEQSLKSPCNWHGVSCSSGRVTQLDLSGSSLQGSISFDPFASLSMLTVLKLNSNRFSINSTSMLRLPYGLKQLDLSLAGLVGSLPETLFSNCPNLALVNLALNNLTGFLPDKFLIKAEKLQTLDVSYNNLTGSISGMKIEAGSCDSLLDINLSQNRLMGAVPQSLSNCSNLQRIDFSSNSLSGEIPKTLGELRSLLSLDLSQNQITGSVPAELGKSSCESLVKLNLQNNNISGLIPSSLSSCASLQILDLSNNNISGPLPDSMFEKLVSLESLILANNAIMGPFPSSLSSCKKLKVIDLSSNRISGTIPRDLCPGAMSLEELRMPDNLIAGEIPSQLSKCSQLKRIDLSLNYLNGSIPSELGDLVYLEKLIAWFNGLEGRIPAELGKCGNLKDLILNNNQLSGEFPRELFNCTNLEWISLTSNMLSGDIPREFGVLTRLAVLQLGNNSFSGEIPLELANCSSLVWLDLNSNKLTGEIPPRLGRQQGARALMGILSGNTLVFVRNVGSSCRGAGGLLEFAGIRPDRLLQVPTLKSCQFTRMYSGAVLSMFTQYQTLEYLDLSYNQLRGKIPDEFGDMIALQVMELSHNQLSGEIPWSLGKLKNLGVFDASHNRLQGTIPDSFSNLSFLVEIDLSSNELTGQIPTRGQLSTLPASQYADNPGLCGVPLPECQVGNNQQSETDDSNEMRYRRKSSSAMSWLNSVVLGILVSVASVCVVVVWAVAVRARRREAEDAKMLGSLQTAHTATTWKIDKEKEPLSINVATFQRQLRKLKFSQLIEATNGFSAASLIGCGGFGEVFKATLKDGSSVAIKKLVRLSCQGDREFMAEMETLGKIKHKNLVPLLGYCKVGEERLLVYEFMDHGSLEEALHGEAARGRPALTWLDRKRIARGAAKGLCFLHHNCIPHIIHRDIKSSNVLLDREMDARVSDFGMARLINALDTHLSVSTLAGTPGYVPPEYYQSFRCTARGDVYSFGVILLEILTGKRPTDKEDFGDTNLVGWVKLKVREGKRIEVIDPALLASSGGEDERERESEEVKEMLRYLEVTLQCVDDFPSKRPNMLQVVAMLRELVPGSTNGSSNSS